ncbi:DUF917 domain-containing protein [Candidatus Bathyarchaeota archaeon]|nr:DUF917 domain-containing protein [Candidatus Bathyarchaeota archaeon]
MRILSKVDLEDYITGSNILGCGGGGSPESGREMVEDAFDRGFRFQLADPGELPQDGLLCILGGVGGGVPEEVRRRVQPYLQRVRETRNERLNRIRNAVRELSEYIGEEFCSYIASETGPGNGVMPMYMAASEGKPVVDGDCCGRAKPELAISLTHVAGIPITPLAMVTPFGETLILKNAIDDYRAEDLCRYAAIASGGGVTVARCPARVEEYRRGMAPNQVSRCISIGAAIRVARERGEDPVEAFIEAAGGKRLFEGVVAQHEVDKRGGFNWGTWLIKGSGEYEGHTYKVWFKNEHLISWLDDKPHVTCPDLICIVETNTCHGLSNFVDSGINNGKNVTVLGIKAYEGWRTKKGIEIFNPKYFGFDIEYIESW